MNEIGNKLKEKREENGVSIEEAADDLKVRPSQLVSLESGSKDDFNDVLFLKYLIRDYSKYLGLNGEVMVDEFNEFLFDLTSKIPIEAIERAKDEKKKEISRILSPYTSYKQEKFKISKLVVIVLILIILIFVGYLIVVSNLEENEFNKNNVTYVVGR